jgi:GNAT superfamily N-acetyltransferase
MTFEIVPADAVPLADQAELFSRAFAGYVGGSFEMDAPALARFICHQGTDLCYSRFARTPEGLTGFAYITRTGNISRVAGMGVVPRARRRGVARGLLNHVLEEARARGDQAMVLEVIQQNPAAHALYVREGFRENGGLFGWRRGVDAPATESREAIEEVSLIKAIQMPNALEFPDLPWPISRHAVAKMARGRAFRTDRALIVISDPQATPIRVHALFCPSPDHMDWSALRSGLNALLHLYSGQEFFTPPVFPEEFGAEVFQPLGFVREPLSQFLMRRDLGNC